ncbi:hypothetical protein LTR08_007836 [Meristemomyces frigidus]|nr:hypothetical protein LTR08_007836 [Meristemomyces frigidus]
MLSREEKLVNVLERRQVRETRACRRSRVASICKGVMVGLPLLVLLVFGVVHVLELITERSLFPRDLGTYQALLRDWGTPGHVGEGFASYATDVTRDILPIPCHSHNDYWRRIPLFDALRSGCTGVEADVWLFGEELFVGHNLAALTSNRTFKNLYVNPLVSLLDNMNPRSSFGEATGHGVFDVDPQQTLVLLVDFKKDGHETFPVVSQQLEALREKGYLTFWDGAKVHSRAVTLVATGNTPFDMVVSNGTYRDIFYDAPLAWEMPKGSIEALELGTSDKASLPLDSKTASGQGNVGTGIISSPNAFNSNNSYYASMSFRHAVGLMWRGHLSHRQMEIIRGQIRGAKRRGLKARYWDTPSWPISLRNRVWRILMDEGADVLNVDDLRAAAKQDWTRIRHDWWR